MALTLIGLALKVPLNWVFMYGNLGAPELGSTGCAVATALISWIVCALAWAWCWFEPGYRPLPACSRAGPGRTRKRWAASCRWACRSA